MDWWLRELEHASIGCSPIKNLQECLFRILRGAQDLGDRKAALDPTGGFR